MALVPSTSRGAPPFTVPSGQVLSVDEFGGGALIQFVGGELDLMGLTASGNQSPQLVVYNDNATSTLGLVTPNAIAVKVLNVIKAMLSSAGVMTAATAAPADGALIAGQCVMWFDQTNGAAKAMFKAKQADGTVRTGSLALV